MRSVIITILVAAAMALTTAGPGQPVKDGKPDPDTRYTAYYFHGKIRCETCLKIEKLSEAALRQSFAELFRQSRLTWQSLNTDLPENVHFRKDFNLSTSSLVLVQESGGKVTRFRLVDQVWDWIQEPDDVFRQKVEEAAAEFMSGPPQAK